MIASILQGVSVDNSSETINSNSNDDLIELPSEEIVIEDSNDAVSNSNMEESISHVIDLVQARWTSKKKYKRNKVCVIKSEYINVTLFDGYAFFYSLKIYQNQKISRIK